MGGELSLSFALFSLQVSLDYNISCVKTVYIRRYADEVVLLLFDKEFKMINVLISEGSFRDRWCVQNQCYYLSKLFNVQLSSVKWPYRIVVRM